MNEAYLKGCLVKALRHEMPGSVVYRHEDQFTAGIPDISVTWREHTAWIEVKFDRPGRRAKITPAQQLALQQLPGILITYVLFKDGGKQTHVSGSGISGSYDGFNHGMIAKSLSYHMEGILR